MKYKENFIKNWEMILFISKYHMKYRYYTKVIEFIVVKSFSVIDNEKFLNLYQKKKFDLGTNLYFFFYIRNKVLNERYKYFMV